LNERRDGVAVPSIRRNVSPQNGLYKSKNASSETRGADVHYRADAPKREVSFAPINGHRKRDAACPKSAIAGLHRLRDLGEVVATDSTTDRLVAISALIGYR